ncbi:hypothetical protein B296_00056160 [Ensete ventricosum]|uniref:Leucine-rich repeat-containing N-terminal plant-type domain-containing protein n=1 Tax=Ensete ventricosum TaxID=4639 RepID=A0A426XWC4_ENSVE|nr:hypothetical protein B296_00056160 [Ensete ventricosum]
MSPATPRTVLSACNFFFPPLPLSNLPPLPFSLTKDRTFVAGTWGTPTFPALLPPSLAASSASSTCKSLPGFLLSSLSSVTIKMGSCLIHGWCCLGCRELYRNNFQGKIPAELGNLRSLISMDLYGNQLQGEIPKSFAKLKSLRFLDLSNNDLCGTIPIDGPFANFPLQRLLPHEIYQGFRHQNVIPCCLCGISVLTTTADSMDLSCKDWSLTISAVESYVSTGVGAYRPRVLPDTLQDGYSTKVTESWNTYNLLCYV